MNFDKIKNAVSPVVKKVAGKVERYSPEITLGAGIVCLAAVPIVVLMKKSKADAIIENRKNRVKEIKDIAVEADNAKGTLEYDRIYNSYTEEDKETDILREKLIAAWEVTKTYAPAIILEIAGITLLVKSHGIMKNRNEILSINYAAIKTAYDEYRKRTAEVVGSEKEKEIYLGNGAKKTQTTTNEDGSEAVEEIEKIDKTNRPSRFAFYFDENSRYWSHRPEDNRAHVMMALAELDSMLIRDGYVTLNTLAKVFGYDKKGNRPFSYKEGQLFGWIDDGTIHKIDLGMLNFDIDGRVLIDPNIDGYIADRL